MQWFPIMATDEENKVFTVNTRKWTKVITGSQKLRIMEITVLWWLIGMGNLVTVSILILALLKFKAKTYFGKMSNISVYVN